MEVKKEGDTVGLGMDSQEGDIVGLGMDSLSPHRSDRPEVTPRGRQDVKIPNLLTD